MKSFQFKAFKIQHNQTAHKVGTDAVLLGAWTSLEHQPQHILDIGAGSGVLALMMAQRSNAECIDAVEINPLAYEECVQNFEDSIWNDRLFCYHGDVQSLAQEPEMTYGLIVSNPPFFDTTEKSECKNRNQARTKETLTATDLIKSVKKMLKINGEFSVILPFYEHEKFIASAKTEGLFINRITQVKGHKKSSFKRSLMQFSLMEKAVKKNQLTLEISRHVYTDEYKALVKDFYLKL